MKALDEWAEAYVRIQKTDDVNTEHEDWWAVDKFHSILLDKASSEHDSCWAAILKILQLTDDKRVLSGLAAGPLEDLVDGFGEVYIDKIIDEAHANPKFRWLLGGVWKSGTEEVWGKVVTARGQAW